MTVVRHSHMSYSYKLLPIRSLCLFGYTCDVSEEIFLSFNFSILCCHGTCTSISRATTLLNLSPLNTPFHNPINAYTSNVSH